MGLRLPPGVDPMESALGLVRLLGHVAFLRDRRGFRTPAFFVHKVLDWEELSLSGLVVGWYRVWKLGNPCRLLG